MVRLRSPQVETTGLRTRSRISMPERFGEENVTGIEARAEVRSSRPLGRAGQHDACRTVASTGASYGARQRMGVRAHCGFEQLRSRFRGISRTGSPPLDKSVMIAARTRHLVLSRAGAGHDPDEHRKTLQGPGSSIRALTREADDGHSGVCVGGQARHPFRCAAMSSRFTWANSLSVTK